MRPPSSSIQGAKPQCGFVESNDILTVVDSLYLLFHVPVPSPLHPLSYPTLFFFKAFTTFSFLYSYCKPVPLFLLWCSHSFSSSCSFSLLLLCQNIASSGNSWDKPSSKCPGPLISGRQPQHVPSHLNFSSLTLNVGIH